MKKKIPNLKFEKSQRKFFCECKNKIKKKYLFIYLRFTKTNTNWTKQNYPEQISILGTESKKSKMPAQEMSNIHNVQEYTTKHIIYDEDYFASYHVTGVLSNTSNGIIYRAERLSDGKNVVIKQVAKKTIKYFYQIHGQPCPAEFVYHFTASAGIGTDFVVKPIEWLEGKYSYISEYLRPHNT